MNSFYSKEECKKLGFAHIGENVLISKKTSFYSPEKIHIGNNVRIDDFTILSGNISIGNFVHISAYAALFAGMVGIEIGDYVSISARSVVYAVSDDYSGEGMTNPMVPDKYRKLQEGRVTIGRHCIIGAGSIILPGVNLKEGSAFGAMCLISRDSEMWSINVGIPATKIKNRKQNILELETEFLKEQNKNI